MSAIPSCSENALEFQELLQEWPSHSESVFVVRNEKSAQRGSFQPDVPADIGPKISSGQAFCHGQAARTSTKKLRSEKLRADFSFPKSQGRKNSININFWPGFPADIPDPCARMPRGQKVSPHHRGRRKTHFLVRTSTIFGADVHDPKGC